MTTPIATEEYSLITSTRACMSQSKGSHCDFFRSLKTVSIRGQKKL